MKIGDRTGSPWSLDAGVENFMLSLPGHPEGQVGDGIEAYCTVVGLKDRMTDIFKEQQPGTDWLKEHWSSTGDIEIVNAGIFTM